MYWYHQLLLTIFLYVLTTAAPRNEEYTTERANEYINKNKASVNQTYRLKYHFMPPIGWINDPNGMIYFQGEYHLFYQFNPYNTLPNKIHWGHAKSKDLVTWEDLPVALAPDRDYDKEGVFSGSAIEKDGKLYVMYTGNSGNRQTQCVAVSEDGIHFEKIPSNPVLDEHDLPGNAQLEDFRDPKVFQRGELYYVVLVSKTLDNRGQVLLYQSKDFIEWEFKSILLEGTKEQGIMWECPDLFELDGKDVLVLSPIQMPRVGNDFHNIDSVIEFVGTVDWDNGTMSYESMKELDHGFDYYATQSLVDDKGRRIVIAWMNMWGRTFPTHNLGHKWQGAMTLPREYRLENNRLLQVPVEEITKLYKNPINLQNIVLEDETTTLEGVSGEVASLELYLDVQQVKRLEIQVRANKEEQTTISYDGASGEVGLDRSKSGIEIVGDEVPHVLARKVKVNLEKNRLHLTVFLDQSSVEVFVNGGKETLTATVYPTQANSEEIRFEVVGKVIVENLVFSKIEV